MVGRRGGRGDGRGDGRRARPRRPRAEVSGLPAATAFPAALADQLAACGLVAVVTVERAEDALPLARALHAGGVRAIELTLRTPAALFALRAIGAELPDLIVGAGTVLTADQVLQAREAGARFAVAPGCTPKVVRAAREAGLPFAPGIATPSDVETALACGCRLLKFFPAVPSGGLPYLRALAAPFHHLGVRYLPLGGIDEATLGDWLIEPAVAAVGGSWLAPQRLIAAGDWAAITAAAARAVDIVACSRPQG